ncbi:helicase-associated domain-containing protein [Kitasatospora sp. NBC_01539]|uniref:helicase-associated domain-containing protein n=1 Tax=Kitasatospora sp. NBC_01539 TaxID=2903577 RepID=UPI0038601BA1
MSTSEALATWLADFSREQLTELLEQRALPYAARLAGGPGVRTLSQLAEHLLTDASVSGALAALNVADMQLMAGVAVLAALRHGPPTEPAGVGLMPVDAYGRDHRRPQDPRPDPARRAVPRADLLDFLRMEGEARREAEAALDRLALRALVLPPHGAKIVVPGLLHRQAAYLSGLGRPLNGLLSRAYQSAEVQRIHRALALPTARTRDERQRAVVALLSDPAQVRDLAEQAPPEAVELLDKLVAGPALLRTRCFQDRYGGYYTSQDSTFAFRPGGSGDAGTDWLAEHGMVVPVGHDLAELPYEIGHALRGPDARPPYDPFPPQPASTAVSPQAAAREAQAAALAAASRVELLLRQVDVQPLTVRKAGGIAVRDTRRVAKQAGMGEEQARLWLDLAFNAGLLLTHAPEPEPAPRGRRRPAPPQVAARVLPTERYDRWLTAPPAQRLLPLIATWAVTPEVFSHWPDEGDTPVALVSPQDPTAVPLRHALLETLAALPEGHGVKTGNVEELRQLEQALLWHQPAAPAQSAESGGPLTATLAEAELLGLVAHGTLTPVGHAVLALLRAGAARYFPAVPGAGPSLKDRPALAQAVLQVARELENLLPAPQNGARFQADLTAVVTGAPSADLTALLSSCADRESEGHAVVWRITAASVRRALDTGTDPEELLKHLTDVSEGARRLPQPLEYLVRDTARTHGRMRVVRSACCIRSDDETLITELSRTRTLTKIGLRRIAPTVLISTADPDTTLAALRKAGYAPVLEAETGTTVIQRAPQERAESKTTSLSDAFRDHGRGSTTAPTLAAALLASTGPGALSKND